VCRLTAAQRKKLELAGRAEIKRWTDQLESVGREFMESARSDPETLRDHIDSLLQASDELFRQGSFLSKAIEQTLNAGQLRARNVNRYERAVSKTVQRLARSLHLSDSQCDNLSSVILRETAVPRKFGQVDSSMVLFQASRLPEAKLKAIFSDIQWTMFKRRIEGGITEEYLKREGYEFGDTPAFPEADPSEPAAGRQASSKQTLTREPK